MTRGLPVAVCSRCGHAVFPERLLCPTCGGADWRTKEIRRGVVEESTLVRRAPGGPLPERAALGTVQLDGGPVVVARLEPSLRPGASVRLEYRDGVPVAEPTEP
jgi:uncharacterized protein